MVDHTITVVKKAGKKIVEKFGKGAIAGAEVSINIGSKTVITLNEKQTPYEHIVYSHHEILHTALELASYHLRAKLDEAEEEKIVEEMQEVFEKTLQKSGLKKMLQKLRYKTG